MDNNSCFPCASVLVKSFLFRRQFHFSFILNIIYWIVIITNNMTKIENVKISNKSIIIIFGLLFF